MAVAATMYRKVYSSFMGAAQRNDLTADTVKVSLHTVTYAPAQDTDQFHSTPTNELAASGNYATGGATISPCSLGVATTKQVNLTGSNAVWTTATLAAARIAVVYDATGGGTEATRPLVGWVDFGVDQNVTGATFTIAWAAGGIAVWSVS